MGIHALRRKLMRFFGRVRKGEDLVVTDRGTVVARLVPAGPASDAYADLAGRFGASVPATSLEDVAARLRPPGAAAGTTDAHLAAGRSPRTG